MKSNTNKPPLHKRYNQEKSIEYIKNRYIRIKERIENQITALQQDQEFRNMCQKYYDKGYPDWVILSAILNCVTNIRIKELGYDILPDQDMFIKISEQLKNIIYPSDVIMEELDFHIKFHAIQCLPTYGFEFRRKDIKPEVIENFLRNRMMHYSHDLPHEPMFGEPVGSWPL